MKDLKGTKTEKNLMDAFAGESQARNKYTYYASQAKKDGYVQIQQIFEETARNEMEHAKLWFKYLLGVPKKISRMLLPVKISNGLKCTSVWQRKPMKKALMKSEDAWN